MFKEWSKGNRIVWDANPDYWGDKAKTPTLELHWSDESAARLLDLQSGTVDGIDNPGTPDIKTIQGDSTLKFYPRAGLNTLFLGFNNTQKPFDDVRVRQAIAMGIDRDQIVKNFYPDGSTVAEYFTPCEIDFACTGDKTWTFDPAGAKTLLAAGRLPGRPGSQRRHQLPGGGPRLQPEPARHRHRDRPAAQEEPRRQRDTEAPRVGRHDRWLHAGHPQGSQPDRLGR